MAFPLLQLAAAAAVLAGIPAEKSYDGGAGELSVAIPSVAAAEIRVDGRLDDAAWAQAALLHSFTQYDPVEGVPASQKTEVLVLVDAGAIYFGVRAFDDRPEAIRATLAERDAFERSDDYVRLVLDTFDDQRRAYVFAVNPLGVQHDGIWNEGGGGRKGMHGPPIDANPDFLWESAGVLAEWGYGVEVRIPLKSLRFPQLAEQAWGLQIMRHIARNGFEESWAPISSNVANGLTQAGKLTGLLDLDAGLFMELNPVLTGKRVGGFDDGLHALLRGDPEAEFGLNATYGLTSNLTLDATYNPDFSHVEADAGQISVNERFALFFPEKRPFFLEGTEIFNLPKQLVYTRSIANPIGGAKMTGKVGSWNVGYLGAVDRDFDGLRNTAANVLRVRRDLGASSTLGLLYTDRTRHADEYNRLGGVDARLVLARRYTLTFLGSGSVTAAPGEERTLGGLWSARVERAGRAFSFTAEAEDSNLGFDAASGFLRRTGITELQSTLRYGFFGKRGGLVERWGPSLEFRGTWGHDDFWAGRSPEERQLQLTTTISFRGNVSIWGTVQRNFYDFAPDAYEGFFAANATGALRPFRPDQSLFGALDGGSVNLFVNTFERVRGNARISVNETPIFDQGVGVEAATSVSGNLSLNLYATRSLQGEVGIRQTRITRQSDGSEYSSALIPRVRAQYQFSRSLFVRGIFEYSTQERGAPQDPATGRPLSYCGTTCSVRTGSQAHDFHAEGLVSYEPSPGTVFYVGYTRQMRDLDPQEFRFRDLTTTEDGLFVKVSYRFRF
ncbi:MAG: DUF5916 domain-containing protein [Longimicrobiales bacterium]|nr:DUF5916 domain-containing protein [Longimicrobiales bacterium]